LSVTGGNFGGYQIYRKTDPGGSPWYDAGTNMASSALSGFLKFGALALLAVPGLQAVAIATTVAMNEAAPKWGSGELVIVPKDCGIVTVCDGHIAGFQSWNNDATWDFMIKGGAANKQYTYTIELSCWGGNAKSGDPYYAGWGDQTPPPPVKLPWGTIPKTKADAKKK